jgi:NAD+ diphosphatase
MSNDNSTINFMSGNPLNRLGWLRSSPKFINSSALSPRTKWLLFRSGNPLIDTRSGSPIEVPIQRIRPLLGPLPYFGQGRLDGEEANEDVKGLESARLRGPKAVFLGVWERERDANGVAMEEIIEGVKGDAYFALDVSDVEGTLLEDVHAQLGVQADYASARTAVSRYDRQQGAIFAAAKSLLEWNSRIKVSCFYIDGR